MQNARLPGWVIAALFVPVAAIALGLNMSHTPPGEVPDAIVHLDRAVEVSQGGFIGRVHGGLAGDYLPAGMAHFDRMLNAERLSRTYSAHDAEQLAGIRWEYGHTFVPFGATTEYPPVAYLPGAAGVAIARLFSDRILVAYYALEVANAMTFIGLVAWALLLFRGLTALIMAGVALLPMTIALAGSPSTDGVVIGASALACAIMYRAFLRQTSVSADRSMIAGNPTGTANVRAEGAAPWPHGLEWAALVLFAVVAVTKPPYFPLLALAGLPQIARHEWGGFVKRVLPLMIVVGLMVAAWYLGGARFQGAFNVVKVDGVSPSRQLHYVLHHPGQDVSVIGRTVITGVKSYWFTFIGVLGWLTVGLPRWTYKALTAGLLVLVLVRLVNARISRAAGALAVVTVAASILLVFATLYADWTPVGAPAVAGIQGRYFLPLVPALVAGTGWEVTRIRATFVWRLTGVVTWLGVATVSMLAATVGLSQGF